MASGGVTLNVTGGKYDGNKGSVASVIYAKNSNVNVTDVNFTNNGTSSSSAVVWMYAGKATLTNVTFEGNKSADTKTQKDAVIEIVDPESSSAVLDSAIAELFEEDLEIEF